MDGKNWGKFGNLLVEFITFFGGGKMSSKLEEKTASRTGGRQGNMAVYW